MLNLQTSDYFNNLPKLIQESIMQSGTHFDDEEQLRSFVSGLEGANA